MAEQEGPRGTTARNIGLGCFLMVPGFFGGGMIGVTVAWIVGGLTKCVAPAGLPACNHLVYLVAGAIVGAILLPALVFWRLSRGAAPENSERS